MPSMFFYDGGNGPSFNMSPPPQRSRRRYGCFGFLFDITMTVVTGGLWLIWIFVREMRG